MIINREMMASILDAYPYASQFTSEFTSYLASELTAIQDTERWLRDADAEEKMLGEEHRKALRQIEEQRAKVIKQCSHHSVSFSDIGDIRVCDTCGKVL